MSVAIASSPPEFSDRKTVADYFSGFSLANMIFLTNSYDLISNYVLQSRTKTISIQSKVSQ